MITLFNESDLVSLGSYLLSDERKARTSEINQPNITHADIENWKEINKEALKDSE